MCQGQVSDICFGVKESELHQLAKVMVSGRRNTGQLRDERGTESTRRNTNEKEQNGGRGELSKQSQANVENIETTNNRCEKSTSVQA